MSHLIDIPAAASCQRDADGRLVGLMFDSVPPLPALAPNPWLVAVDSSDNALRAVTQAAALAGALTSCALHLVSVQPWLSLEAAEAELARRAWQTTARARTLLDARRQPWRLHVAMGETAEQILALAAHLGCSRIVIGSRGLSVTESLLLGSLTSKLMRLSPRPVMVVPGPHCPASADI
jgi:nucleotide-binding universal stress UspA family protein